MKADPQDPLPFCYTTDPNVRWEHCDCDDNQMGCTVSTTIQGIVMLAYNSLWPIVYQPVTSMLVTDVGDQMLVPQDLSMYSKESLLYLTLC